MQMHFPHIHLPQMFQHTPQPRHIPTTDEFAALFRAARMDLQVLDAEFAAQRTVYENQRKGIITRMANLIEANELYYGTDLRKYE